MKIYKIANKDIKKQMEEWFNQRTGDHIGTVQAYCQKISKQFPEFAELIERGEIHDQSKYKDPEIDPYIYTTWKYKCKDEGWDFEECDPPDDIDDKMQEATLHHIFNNRHHPEFHLPKHKQTKDVLNEKDRDAKPDSIVDASKMTRLDIAEMVADWCSVSKERGGSPKDWADKNVNVRWEFTNEQKDLIYELIEAVWE
jgi:hypothetical protein